MYAQWKPEGGKIKTTWAEQINPEKVLPEYPRPLLERAEWRNLNGLWNYAIRGEGLPEPESFDGKILVPFAVESSLSGVGKTVGRDNELWYSRTFTVPPTWKNKNVILHFGAVDWKAEVYLNDIKIGSHTGGYTPFCFDITAFLKAGEQKLTVKVWDPTDNRSYQPRGKQVSNPEGIMYTSVTGIWQTVWIEPVGEKHIASMKTVSDIDKSLLTVTVDARNTKRSDVVEVKVSDNGKVVSQIKSVISETVTLHIPDAKLWSPDSPFLYDVDIALYSNGAIVDQVKSYSAMRKISTGRDHNGIVRLKLNNKNLFQFGPLDQGWWPDGLYTAPTDEALAFDIVKTKELGFNMIRKHVKVEPARWYTHCDRLGILVWQDMPSGGESGPQWQTNQYFNGTEAVRSAESEANYFKEWKEIIDLLYSNPSVVVWVPFNESWGQFKTPEVVAWTKTYDPSRLINPASGGNHYHTGDILDIHNYPQPRLYMYDDERATVLGEYGGIGLALQDHLWQPEKNWGYVQFKTSKEVTDEYVKFAEELKTLIKHGFSGAVYTQTTDVEGEVNGLITYDRKVVKVEVDRLKKVNREICNILE
jgi:beta-galactosidase/beta-glucuronidase